MKLLEESLILYKKIEHCTMLSSTYCTLCLIYNELHLPDKTIYYCENAISIESKLDSHSGLIRCYRILIDAYKIKDDWKSILFYSDKVKEELKTRIPLGRMGSPRDVAAAIVFLASDEAGYITGQALNVNGGIHLA